MGVDQDLLAELHQACQQEGILRKTSLPGSAQQGDIIQWLQKGDLRRAVEQLLLATENTALYHDVSLTSGQVNALLNEKSMLDTRDFFPRMNKLADTILQLAKQLPAV